MHPNEALARREIELIEAGKFDELRELYTDDFVFHYPGRSPLAGTYTSFDDFLTKAQKVFGPEPAIKRALHDAFGSDEHAVQVLQVTATVSGKSHSWRGIVLAHVRDGKFSEMWVTIEDLYALDDFLNSLSG